MNALVMIPNKTGFLFSDLDIAGCLERCLGATVVELDPDANLQNGWDVWP